MSQLRSLVAVVAVLCVVGAPALADDHDDPLIVDPCGDADTRVTVGGDETTLEEGLGHVDLRAGDLQLLYDDEEVAGVVATIDVCGEASAERGGYHIQWGFADGCHQSLTWTKLHEEAGRFLREPSTDVSLTPRSVYEERCRDGNHSYTVFFETLPEHVISFDGSTVTFTLDLDLVPADGRGRFAIGTVWRNAAALAMDQDASTFAFAGGDIPYTEVWVRSDMAWAHRTFVVEPPPTDD